MATSIPVLDLSLADSLHTRSNFLKDLRSALLDVGFLYVSNHGVPASTVNGLVDILPSLFNLPNEEKEKIALINSPHFLGHHAFGNEITAGAQDQKEVFDFATELPDFYSRDPNQPLYTRLQGPNQWPARPAELQSIVTTYMAALTTLGDRFVRLVAESLDLPSTTFDSYVAQQHRLKLIHYRSSPNPSSNQGVGPHKDSSGWLTLLLQASCSPIPNTPDQNQGLQVLSKSGTWHPVPAIPDTFVVNVGQPFEVVTNGTCKATTHRVLLPEAVASERHSGEWHRYSVPFFQGVRLDLTKRDCKALWTYFDRHRPEWKETDESVEGAQIDSAFLQSRYETWGEVQLRTKIRSHRDVGRKWYAGVCERYFDEM